MSDETAPASRGEGGSDDGGGLGLWSVVSIGVGGMIGAGIFSVLGVAYDIAGAGAPVGFALAGGLALLCAWSFGRLGAAYSSAGGPAEYTIQGFGAGHLSGVVNGLLWLGYVLVMAMYARAFGSYAAGLMPEGALLAHPPALAAGVTMLFLAINVVGAEAMGKAELAVTAGSVIVLVGFAALAAPGADPSRLAPSEWEGIGGVLYAGAVVFVAYEGFGLITNAAEDMERPTTLLPRALALSVVITMAVYVAVAGAAAMAAPMGEIVATGERALAVAAEPALGEAGSVVIAIAALLATASAINATLYGGAQVSYIMARDGQLPAFFRREIWRVDRAGLFITAALVAVIGAWLPVGDIAMMASAAFLVVYGAVHAAHLRLLEKTGASAWLVWAALAGCAVVFVALAVYLAQHELRNLWMLAGMGALVAAWQVIFGRVAGRPVEETQREREGEPERAEEMRADGEESDEEESGEEA